MNWLLHDKRALRAIFGTLWLACASPAWAQTLPRVGVVVRPGISAPLRKDVLSALNEQYEVTNPGSSSRRNALQGLGGRIRAAQLELVLVLRKQGGALTLQYFDGRGRSRGSVRLALRRGKLTPLALRKLSTITDDRLAAQAE